MIEQAKMQDMAAVNQARGLSGALAQQRLFSGNLLQTAYYVVWVPDNEILGIFSDPLKAVAVLNLHNDIKGTNWGAVESFGLDIVPPYIQGEMWNNIREGSFNE